MTRGDQYKTNGVGAGPSDHALFFLTNESGFVKQTVKTNTLPSASGTAILEVSDIPRNERRQNKRTKDKCVIGMEERAWHARS